MSEHIVLYPGARAGAEQRAGQIEIMRTAAIEAGRDADALEYTRWGTIDMPEADVDADAETGLRGWVVGPSTTDPRDQRDEVSAFAERLKLG